MHVTVDIDWQVMGQLVMVSVARDNYYASFQMIFFCIAQILMNAWTTMGDAIKHVPTVLAHLNVVVFLDTFYLMIT